MHRLASVHLQPCSHHFSRLSVTIVTATGQRTSSTRSLVAFTEEQVCGQKFLRDFAAACRKLSPLVEFTMRALGQKY